MMSNVFSIISKVLEVQIIQWIFLTSRQVKEIHLRYNLTQLQIHLLIAGMAMKKRSLILTILFISLLFAAVPFLITPAEGTDPVHSTITPTAEKNSNQNSLQIQAGDTGGLILGATLIVITIFIGILIQNVPFRKAPESSPPQDEHQEKP